MSIDALKAAFPEYAKDIKLNLSSISNYTNLTEQQLYGTLLAAAIASRNPMVLSELSEETSKHLDESAIAAAKSAAAIMAMNNIYYRTTHMLENHDYSTMRAGLRMNVIGNPGVDKADFELWSLAVSAINGCASCINAHEHEVVEKGISKEAVQEAIKIAAIVHAAAVTLEAESTLGA